MEQTWHCNQKIRFIIQIQKRYSSKQPIKEDMFPNFITMILES
jgi:hypothetical protein